MDRREENLFEYPLDWSDEKIKYFDQIRHKRETPQNLFRSTRYYLTKYEQFKDKPFWFDWHWAFYMTSTCFFTLYWMAYRRFYQPLAMFVGSILLIGLAIYIMYQETLNSTISVWLAVLIILVSIGSIISTFMITNRLYINKILSRIKHPQKPLHPSILRGVLVVLGELCLISIPVYLFSGEIIVNVISNLKSNF